MSTFPPSSPQFELRHSSSAIFDLPTPKYMSLDYFLKADHAAISEVEIVVIDGHQFVDLDSTQAKMLMLRSKYS